MLILLKKLKGCDSCKKKRKKEKDPLEYYLKMINFTIFNKLKVWENGRLSKSIYKNTTKRSERYNFHISGSFQAPKPFYEKKKKKCSGTLSSILYFLILLFLGWPKIFILVILNSLLGEGTYSYLHSLSSKQEDEPQNMN